MFRKCVRSFIEAMGLLAIIFTILSLVFPDEIQIRFLHLAVCVIFPIHLFSFFTFQLKLFSRHLLIRRIIVISFSVSIMVVVNYIFGYFRFELDYLIVSCIAILLFIVVTVFAYYIGDKIEQRNLNLINQKLDEKNTKNM